MARARACALVIFMCRKSGSMIWSPTRKTGFSEVIGSWKTKPTLAPRMSCSSRSVICKRSRDPSMTWPPRTSAGGVGRRPTSDIIVTDLPEPLSPTTPRSSPRARVKLTRLTACTSPERVRKTVFRPRTSSTGAPRSGIGFSPRPCFIGLIQGRALRGPRAVCASLTILPNRSILNLCQRHGVFLGRMTGRTRRMPKAGLARGLPRRE